MNKALQTKLTKLADLYETPDFLEKDPSKFMHHYKNPCDQEIIAFIAANLAFGRRDQILSHTEIICSSIKELGDDSPSEWIKKQCYRKLFTKGENSFYRMMSHDTMLLLCDTLKNLTGKYGSFGDAVKAAYSRNTTALLHQTIASLFPKECSIICQGKNAAAKRLQMFLRWMVRDSSPVDLGLWTSWYDKKKLLIPLDTHVMQQSVSLGLINKTSSDKIPAPTLKLDIELTKKLEEAFPGDPVRADYALFGLGVNKEN